MSLKYYTNNKALNGTRPKKSYIEDFAAINDLTLENAATVYYGDEDDAVYFEYEYGSGKFSPLPLVRVDNVVNYNTGILIGDDFKNFIFLSDFQVPLEYGMKFKWKNSYWLVINTNRYSSISNSVEVRRCNNVLRFFDKYGNKVEEPCIMDATLRFANNNEIPPITVGGGEQKIWCQRNSKTVTLRPNDRFLFGPPEQRVCFRLYAGGAKNFLNTITLDDNSPSLTEFYVEHYEINEVFDDLENGYADAYTHNYKIEINNVSDDYLVNVESQLKATVYKNDDIVDMEVEWETSDANIVEIDANGLLKTKKEGTAIITAKVKENNNISTNINIVVQQEASSNEYEIVVDPDVNYILQGNTKIIECKLYLNGKETDETFEFKDETVGVPIDNYTIKIVDGNHFEVINKKMYMNKPVLVRCINKNKEKIISIKLRGLY